VSNTAYMDHLSGKKEGRGDNDFGSEGGGPPQDTDEVTTDVIKKEKAETQVKEVRASVFIQSGKRNTRFMVCT